MTYPNRFTHLQSPLQNSNATPQAPPSTTAAEPQPSTPPPSATVVCVYEDPNKLDRALAEHLLVSAAEAKRPPAKPAPSSNESDHTPPEPDPPNKQERHSRKCAICHHPERDAIEQAYIHWATPHAIKEEFGLPSRLGIYRHALATGLSLRRRRKMVYALEMIVEQAGRTEPNADAVIRAVRACSRLNEDGRWIEPTRRVILDHRSTAEALPAASAQLPDAATPRTITIELAQQDTAENGISAKEQEF
jgi:hypothetical protein